MESSAAPAPMILCPVENQRSVHGLTLKLFVVHFVTLCFYFHCYHQRQGRYLTIDAFVFIIAPLNTVFRYVVALLGIAGYASFGFAYSLFIDNREDYQRKLRKDSIRALGTLLGRKRRSKQHNLPLLDDPTNESLSDIIASKLGPAISAIVFIVQCCGTIHLYRRRLHLDGVTIVDQHIFEHACGGLVIGLLSIGYTLRLPLFDLPVPEDSGYTYLAKFVLLLRDQGDYEIYGGQGSRLLLQYFPKVLAIAFCVQLVVSNPALSEEYREEVRFYSWTIFVFGLCAVGIVHVANWHLMSESTKFINRFECLDILLRVVAACCLVSAAIFLSMLCIIALMVGFGGSFTPHVMLGIELRQLENVPLDQPCPLLWIDPQAEYIWWLA